MLNSDQLLPWTSECQRQLFFSLLSIQSRQLTGPILSNGAHTFIPALMSNHSAQAPNGVLTRDVLKSFFGVQGSSANLTYKVGYEVRVP